MPILVSLQAFGLITTDIEVVHHPEYFILVTVGCITISSDNVAILL